MASGTVDNPQAQRGGVRPSSPSPGRQVSGDLDEVVTLTAIPNENRVLEGWYFNGRKVSTNNVYNFKIISEEGEILVRFKTTDGTYEVAELPTERKIYGTVTGYNIYDEGDICTLTVIPTDPTNHRFLGWVDKSANTYNTATYLSTSTTYTFVVTRDFWISAAFD